MSDELEKKTGGSVGPIGGGSSISRALALIRAQAEKAALAAKGGGSAPAGGAGGSVPAVVAGKTPVAGRAGATADRSGSAVVVSGGSTAVASGGDARRPSWAVAFGQDGYGSWADFAYKGVTQRCRWIPAGTLLLGSADDEVEHNSGEGPQQRITFRSGYWLMDTALTQGLYAAVTGDNPSRFKGDDLPVENVSWDDAQAFARRINSEIPGLGLRLPSEAEWEYACRAGSTTPFDASVARKYAGWNITTDEANYDGNYPYRDGQKGECRGTTVPVKGAGFAPNAWGLWHMHGNVFEWCEDVWRNSHGGYDPAGAARRPGAEDASGGRDCVFRGGSWGSDGWLLRSADRSWFGSGVRFDFIGVRFAPGHGG